MVSFAGQRFLVVTRMRSRARFTVVLALLGSLTPALAAEEFAAAAKRVSATVREHYAHLHRYPELGKQEVHTAEYLKAQLATYGYTRFETLASLPTAVITTFDTKQPGRTIALRADIDARPQQEATSLVYRSTIDGVMHSCGHDAHTAILLGVAELLPQVRKQLRGKIILVFQPAEETAGGADDIVASGILEQLGVEAIFALHVAPGLPVGTIQVSPGAVMAGSNYFTIRLKGRESHAAAPQEGDDISTCTAQLASELPTILTRRTDILTQPTLLSITYLNSGNEKALNVLPSEGIIKGTIRSYQDIDDPIRGSTLRSLIQAYVTSTTERCGAMSTIEIREAAPPTTNNLELYERVAPIITAAWPSSVGEQGRGMFSEDFAYYTATIPSLYFSLGIQQGQLGNDPVHTSTFTIHPDALPHGVRLLLLTAAAGTK